MGVQERPLRVGARENDVVCLGCGAVWASGLPSPQDAAELARRMNGDPKADPGRHRARNGLCHGSSSREKWALPAEVWQGPISSVGWEDRIVVAQGEPLPENDGPPMGMTATIPMALAYSVFRAPAGIGRALLAAGVALAPWLVVLAVLALGMTKVGVPHPVMAAVQTGAVVLGILTALVAAALAATVWARRTPAVEHEDTTKVHSIHRP